ncbi:MAG: RNA pseudouridine synthase, partial [Akkermansiaceae bacterium]|nr:RNA pseudouridine synthase [Akkermansiaceae bacterium]
MRERMGSGTWEAVHRLDRDTSGCLLLAENPAARDQALALFRRREIAKA